MSHACTPILVDVYIFSGFRDIATFKNGQISLSNNGLSPRSPKDSINRNWFKKLMQVGLMSHACPPILVDVPFPVSEILLPSKMAKLPFLIMDYSPWSSKNSINWNQLKKFMLVWVDVKCMYNDLGGHDLFGFRDTVTFKNGQISLSDHGL